MRSICLSPQLCVPSSCLEVQLGYHYFSCRSAQTSLPTCFEMARVVLQLWLLADRAFHRAVVQFFLTPLLLWRNFLSASLSIALYVVAFVHYHYLSFLGYNSLPFLEHTQVCTAPRRAQARASASVRLLHRLRPSCWHLSWCRLND